MVNQLYFNKKLFGKTKKGRRKRWVGYCGNQGSKCFKKVTILSSAAAEDWDVTIGLSHVGVICDQGSSGREMGTKRGWVGSCEKSNRKTGDNEQKQLYYLIQKE